MYKNKTLFFSGYHEIFIPRPESIILYNYFEDNRLFLGLDICYQRTSFSFSEDNDEKYPTKGKGPLI